MTDKKKFEDFGTLLRYTKKEIKINNHTLILFTDKGNDGNVYSLGYDEIYMGGKFDYVGKIIKIWMISHVAFWPLDFRETFKDLLYN